MLAPLPGNASKNSQNVAQAVVLLEFDSVSLVQCRACRDLDKIKLSSWQPRYLIDASFHH